jgi:hypothetical protein
MAPEPVMTAAAVFVTAMPIFASRAKSIDFIEAS